MTYLIILLALAAGMAVASLRALLHDGRGPSSPPASHVEDLRFRAPAAG